MIFKGFVGPSYKLDSVNVDCQRTVNLYPEKIENENGKQNQVAYLRNTPGLNKILEIGDGPIRLIFEDSYGQTFVISGDELHLINKIAGVWTDVSTLGTLDTTTGPVRFASYLIGDVGSEQWTTVLVDGANNYAIQSTPIGNTFGTFASFGYPPVVGATHVELIDGYFIYNKNLSNQFYVSEIGSLVVDPLSFASAEGDPDYIVGLISNQRNLLLFNERSVEMWANTGNADFPFERVSGGFFELGCAARYSIAKINGVVFWLGRTKVGQGVVYAMSGFSPQRISTHAIEQAISGYANIGNATSYTYEKNGHYFYVLNFEEATWVYDLATGEWHERAFLGEDGLERHRADSVSFCSRDIAIFAQSYGHLLAGDYASNKVYILDENYYYDDETEISKMRTFPHASNEGKNVFYHSLQIDMETGIGLDGDVLGSDPKIILRFSNDGGHTWTSENPTTAGRKIGGIGQYKTRVKWNRLGSARDRVFEIKCTDPVPIKMTAAYLDAESGDS